MIIAQKIALCIAVICLSLMLNACGADYGAAVVGTWKDLSQERYLTIEKTTALGSSNKEKYRAIIYAPNSSVTGEGAAQTEMNHMSMPASVKDGIMILNLEAGDIAVLYDPNNQQVVLNGTDTYQRVPEDIVQLKLETGRSVNH